MERRYKEAYAGLNQQQRRAVDIIDGPLLVIAGPGTGKTELLSVRGANILHKTDAEPGNILCLTFTDNAARNMRERLISIIGRPAYHVAIHTFHSFGADVISRYPDYFERQMVQQVDELGRYELLSQIFEALPHGNPLSAKIGDNYIFLKDTLDVIGWLKQNAVTPAGLHQFLAANQKAIEQLSDQLAAAFRHTPSPELLPEYRRFMRSVKRMAGGRRILGFMDFAGQCAAELEKAIASTASAGRFAPEITRWRNNWCQKNASGEYIFKDGGRNHRKMQALAGVYQALSDTMAEQGLYDFDDMVMEAVQAMETNDELRFNLQERYQYVLVDEFQDTNKAQLRMMVALGDNPVHEGRPNLMAVGDDDQAIYAFQGAETSNMAAFINLYGTEPIVLRQNYRSAAGILKTAGEVAGQITDRLSAVVPSADKQLSAEKRYPSASLDYLCFTSELAQYSWIAEEAAKLIESGTEPDRIAVVAPRHRYLERLMPYLGDRSIPVAYERRENILEAPIIVQVTSMVELVVAIAENRQDDVDALLGQVLGYDFWGLSAEQLMDVSLECYRKKRHWLEVLSQDRDPEIRTIVEWFIGLARRSRLEPMEYLLDQLVGDSQEGPGNESGDIEQPAKTRSGRFVSPLKEYYFSLERYEQATESYLTFLGQLSTLRQRLRQWKPNRLLLAKDLSEFIRLNLAAGLKIVDDNPHTQTTNAVMVMTAYKAKGLEFETVFVINAQDEVWGPTARSRGSRVSLPRNLPIAPAGDSDNDRLRLVYVAMTRAKHTLHITGYSRDLENKPSPPLSFLEGIAGLPIRLVDKPASVKAVEILSTDWSYRFRQVIAARPALMAPVLDDYKLSVTHLNNFIDVANGGPRYFLLHNLLRFPEAMSPSAAYGDSIHQTISWLHGELRRDGRLPPSTSIERFFTDMLGRKHLRKTDHTRLEQRGREALKRYLAARSDVFRKADLAERGFNNDGVVVGEARLTGKIDLIRFEGSTASVLDFKTGRPALDWQGHDEFEKIKLHKYRQQLLFYKLLVEHSASFQRRYTAGRGKLEFVEADDQGKLAPGLEVEYDPKEMAAFIKLIGAVWASIQNLDFPDVSAYPSTLAGIRQFETDLIEPPKKPPA